MSIRQMTAIMVFMAAGIQISRFPMTGWKAHLKETEPVPTESMVILPNMGSGVLRM